MTTPPPPAPPDSPPARDLRQVAWLTLALFLSYLCVAIALPVTSLQVSAGLGYGNALAGIAVGIAFASTILTRGLAGRLSDQRGGKHSMLRGLAIYALAGLVCAASALPGLPPGLAYAVLIAGRLLLGWGESLATVGLVAWALGIAGPARSGRVFGLVGMGLYGAFAVGSPLGLALMEQAGFAGAMLACALLPLLGLLLVAPVAAVAPPGGERPSFWRILGRIWQPGLVVGLQGVGFAAIGAFMALLFLARGWPHAGLGLTCFGLAFVAVRVVAGHLPDRLGSIPVALVSIAVEAAGQYLLWLAPGPELALAGATLTGLGCSLIFPTMGIEVMRRVAPNLRGTAAGGFSAYQDLAYGLTGPVTGLLADRFGHAAVFLVGGLAATGGFVMLLRMAALRRAG